MAHITFRDYLQSIEDALTAEQVDKALSRCQYVQAQFPDALEVQRLLGETYLKQGMMQEAQQAFDWVLTNDPENVVVYCDRALISERMADYETALDCYQQAYELSRGNRSIRQQFNILSANTGQQGFMLSRAGLARLYMRGDLLSQAEQEWQMVLSVTPERLDARTGLLETYWREGFDERVEQLAYQILHDIPECLKALLLLAHVTAPRDMQQARELIQHAEALDPDLLMARELFGDAIAAQPGHPFWKLVNKAPVVLKPALPEEQEEQRGQEEPVLASVMREQVLIPDSLSSLSSRESSPDSPNNWNGLTDWQELQGWQGADALTDTPEQSSPSSSSHDINDIYASLMGREEKTFETFASESIEDRPTMEVPLHQSKSEQSEDMLSLDAMHAEWMKAEYEQDAASSTYPEQGDIWASSMPLQNKSQDAISSPPSWLSMLTQDEQHMQWEQPLDSSASPTLLSSPETQISHIDQLNALQGADERESSRAREMNRNESADAWRSELQSSLNQASMSDEEDESFFGPAWLKSLGAASIDEEPQPTHEEHSQFEERAVPEITHVAPPEALAPSQPIEPILQSTLPSAFEPQMPSSDTYEWMNALALSTTESVQEEQNLLTTLEGLEQDLREQGFVPLEPNTLSTIAQSQQEREETASAHQPAFDANEVQEMVSTLHWSEPSSQDTLWAAHLPSVPSPTPVVFSTAKDDESSSKTEQSAVESNADEVEQERPVALPAQLSYPMPVEQTSWKEMPDESVAVPVPDESMKGTPQTPIVSEPAFSPEPLPVPVPWNERLRPAASLNDVFSDDLEVTMKRPAVRLQPVGQTRKPQSASVPPVSPVSVASSAHTGQRERVERREPQSVNRIDGSVSNQERLRRGYQHQLVGDYDEAMQEYRVIIRNAPELLGEVVSNVRALLQIAPKYSAGYRVLGDAYMRQGEYLQAMDAYNQALAITKKARV